MTNENNNLVHKTLWRRASWLAILPVALLQLTLAFHQFDHIDDYVEGTCHVCVQLDRVDAPVDHSAQTNPVVASNVLRPDSLAVPETRIAVRVYDSRAPPQL